MVVAWWPAWGEGLLLAAGATMVWALALYLITRAPPRRVPILATAAMLLLAVYQLGQALGAFAPDLRDWVIWLERTWWAPAVAPASWLLLTVALADAEGSPHVAALARRAFWPAAVVFGGAALVFAVTGTATTLLQDWDRAYEVEQTVLRLGPGTTRHAPAGPLFVPFQVYVLVCLLASFGIIARLWHTSPPGTPLRARFGWLLVSAALFMAGAGWIVIVSGVFAVTGLPEHVLVITGVLILGYNLARYGALLAGEQVTADFLGYSLAMLAIVGLYGAIILVLAPPDFGWLERALVLLFVVMTTHVAVATRGHLLDRLLYGPVRGVLRGQLRELSNRVVRQPDSVTALVDVRETVDDMLREGESRDSPELRVLVEGALRRMNDLPGLSQHPLLAELARTAEYDGSPLERAAVLRSELEQAIERLRPSGARPSPGGGVVGGWLHYLVLREAYLDGRPNKQIMQRYTLSEGTFHRARRRAIDAITLDLAQRSTAPSASSRV